MAKNKRSLYITVTFNKDEKLIYDALIQKAKEEAENQNLSGWNKNKCGKRIIMKDINQYLKTNANL